MLVILCYWQIQYVALRALKIAFQLCCFWATRGALSYYMIFPSKTWKKCILRETQGVEILIKYIVGYTEEVITSRHFFYVAFRQHEANYKNSNLEKHSSLLFEMVTRQRNSCYIPCFSPCKTWLVPPPYTRPSKNFISYNTEIQTGLVVNCSQKMTLQLVVLALLNHH